MFMITDEDGNLLKQVEEVRYIKRGKSGAWIRCRDSDAQGIAIDGVKYSLPNRDPISDTSLAFIHFVDAAQSLHTLTKSTQKNATDIEVLSQAVVLMATEIVNYIKE